MAVDGYLTHEDMASLLDAADERAMKRFMAVIDQQSRGTERRYTWDFASGNFNTGDSTLDLPSWARFFTLVVGANANTAATLDSLTIEVNGLPETIAAGTTGSIGYSLLAGGGTLKITTSATSPKGQLYVRIADRVIGQVHGGSMPSVSLTGSSAPLTAATPTLLDTIPYSAFTASGSLVKTYSAVLHRNARGRTVVAQNNLNQALSSLSLYPWESTANGVVGTQVAASQISVTAPGIDTQGAYSSDQYGGLGANVDSLTVVLGMGATTPTSGNVYLYAVEMF